MPLGVAKRRPSPKICGASAYVNFDFDSATIRPDSEQVLADLYERLIKGLAKKVAACAG